MSYWINSPNIGPKKAIALFLILLLSPSVSKFVLPIGFVVYLIRQGVMHGFSHRLYKDKKYMVFDTLHPLRPQENTRSILSRTDQVISSRVFLSGNARRSGYLDIVRVIYKNWFPQGNRWRELLFLGGGGGSLPLFFASRFARLRIDVVELDSTMIAMAKRYFFPLFRFKNNNVNLIHQDGRQFLSKKTQKQYDFIFQDMFDGARLPKALDTPQWLQLPLEKLKRGGVLLINCGIHTSPAALETLVRYMNSEKIKTFQRIPFAWERNYFLLIQKTVPRSGQARLTEKQQQSLLTNRAALFVPPSLSSTTR